jgi:hypothetical protein
MAYTIRSQLNLRHKLAGRSRVAMLLLERACSHGTLVIPASVSDSGEREVVPVTNAMVRAAEVVMKHLLPVMRDIPVADVGHPLDAISEGELAERLAGLLQARPELTARLLEHLPARPVGSHHREPVLIEGHHTRSESDGG